MILESLTFACILEVRSVLVWCCKCLTHAYTATKAGNNQVFTRRTRTVCEEQMSSGIETSHANEGKKNIENQAGGGRRSVYRTRDGGGGVCKKWHNRSYPKFLVLRYLALDELAERQLAVGDEQVFDDGVVEHGQAQPVGLVHVLREVLVPDRVVRLGHGGRPQQYVVVHVDADVGVQQRVLGLQERHVLETGLQVGGPQPGRFAQFDAYRAGERLLVHGRNRSIAGADVLFFLHAGSSSGRETGAAGSARGRRSLRRKRRRLTKKKKKNDDGTRARPPLGRRRNGVTTGHGGRWHCDERRW